MNQNNQEYIDILIGLEPVFKKAGELALKMRKTAGSKNKYSTGIAVIDIVTEADTAVQEMILAEMAKTKLVECQLFAEENTPSVSKFKGTNGLVLTLDPIDGTLFYASTGKFYSTIVTLHNKKDILYTFHNYPEINWSRRIAGGKIIDSGELPEIKTKETIRLDKTIVYTLRGPKNMDQAVYNKLVEQGYEFRKASEITDDAPACAVFFSGKVAGFYIEGPNPYDGIYAMLYGQTKKLKIYSTLDLSTYTINDHGPHYVGWYLVLQ